MREATNTTSSQAQAVSVPNRSTHHENTWTFRDIRLRQLAREIDQVPDNVPARLEPFLPMQRARPN